MRVHILMLKDLGSKLTKPDMKAVGNKTGGGEILIRLPLEYKHHNCKDLFTAQFLVPSAW